MPEEIQIPGDEPSQEVRFPGGEPKPDKLKARPATRGLPDADSVDPKKINRAVLSADGWVVPIKPEKK